MHAYNVSNQPTKTAGHTTHSPTPKTTLAVSLTTPLLEVSNREHLSLFIKRSKRISSKVLTFIPVEAITGFASAAQGTPFTGQTKVQAALSRAGVNPDFYTKSLL